jgi:hypothetical protein
MFLFVRNADTHYAQNTWEELNIVFTVHLVHIKNQDQLDAQSLLKTLIVVLH